jgi:hypothetical protein
MAKTKKTIQLRNLIKYDVLIEDTSPSSPYFQVTNLPSVFTGGRNSFLLAGSPYLKPGSAIQIEILDAAGNTIYQNPVQKYVEGNSRVVSVEVTEDVVPGFATIILLGQAIVTSTGQPIPPDWQNTYNVRWTKTVLVEPNLRNSSPLILQTTPSVFSEEQRLYSVLTSSFTSQNTTFTASISPLLYSSTPIGYFIQAESPTTFSADLLGGHITGSLVIDNTSASIYIPITDILNETKAFSTGHLVQTDTGTIVQSMKTLYSGSYATDVNKLPSEVTSSARIVYDILTVENLHIPVSYAKLRVVNLNSVSGEIFKVRIYSKVATNFSDYKLVADIPITTSELLVSASVRGEFAIGNFNISPSASDSWYSYRLETSSNVIYPISGSFEYYNPVNTTTSYSLSVTDDILLRSVRADVPIYNNQQYAGYTSASGYFLGTKRNVTLFPSTEYTLELDAVYSNSSGSVNLVGISPKVDIYIVGTSNTQVIDNNPLGQLVGTLTVNVGSLGQRYERRQFNFIPAIAVGGSVGVRFVVTNGFWYFSNISLKPASDRLFAPDEVQFIVPNTEYHNEYLQHKIEFFDINNNSTEISAVSVPTFFTGSNIDLGELP